MPFDANSILDWDHDADAICTRIRSNFQKLKIVLKTKEDSFFFRKWYKHHANIAGAAGLIVFDNMSDQSQLADLYGDTSSETVLCRFSGLHNNIHDTTIFKKLYDALKASCDFFAFLDTDELLTLYQDGRLVGDARILDFLARAKDPIYPGVWLSNKPGSTERFEMTQDSLVGGIRWGKPVINATLPLTGYVNHNSQINPRFYSREVDTRFVIKHLSKLSSKQRIRVNLEKLDKRNYFKTDDHLEEASTADLNSISNKNIRAYVAEIQDLVRRPYEEGEPSEQLTEKECHIDEVSGEITFHSPAQRSVFEGIVAHPSKVGHLINKSTDAAQMSEMTLRPHMTESELVVFEKWLEKCKVLMEFGCGGSTVFAAHKGVETIYSVDSDLAWLNKVGQAPELAKVNFTPLYIDVGPTGKWGTPVGNGSAFKWPDYYRSVWQKLSAAPDLVLVDGRFRVACALTSCLHCKPGTPIIFHDFWDRPQYFDVLEFLNCVDRIDNIAVFTAKENIDWRRLAIVLSTHILDVK
jgi:hypothetical protein